MKTPSISNPDIRKQFAIGISAIILISTGCFFLADFVGYRVIALLLLVTVSISAIFYDIKPVLTIAVLSALIWDYFFIPPRFTLAIKNAEDLLMFLMYFLIALVNAVFTTRVRKMQREAGKRKERENLIGLYNVLLNSLSHELRTPISTIVGATDNLQDMSDKLSEHDKRELLKEISKASLQLNRQVENLLNMSRLESGYLKPKLDWIDLRELIYDVTKHLGENPNALPIKIIAPDQLPLFKTDYGLFYQVLHNLLHNALTYVPIDATIEVKVSLTDYGFELSVEDSGKGFPESEISRVFDKFYRLKHSGTGGTGLGLSIARGFTEALGGSITLVNRSPMGAKFTIEMPCEVSLVKG